MTVRDRFFFIINEMHLFYDKRNRTINQRGNIAEPRMLLMAGLADHATTYKYFKREGEKMSRYSELYPVYF